MQKVEYSNEWTFDLLFLSFCEHFIYPFLVLRLECPHCEWLLKAGEARKWILPNVSPERSILILIRPV